MLSNGQNFEEKAKKLMQKLSSISTFGNRSSNTRNQRSRIDIGSSLGVDELLKLGQEIQLSDEDSRRKMRALHEQIRKLEINLNEQNDARAKMNDNFVATVSKVQKNLKVALINLKKGLAEKESKLTDKIELLLRGQRKELQLKLQDNQNLIEEIKHVEIKVSAIVDQIQVLKRSRLDVEGKINKQFMEQIRQLKRIFEKDVREREEKENNIIASLKVMYKSALSSIQHQENQRQANEKLLLTVVEQLINRIVET